MIWKIRKLSQVDFLVLKEKNKSVTRLEIDTFRLHWLTMSLTVLYSPTLPTSYMDERVWSTSRLSLYNFKTVIFNLQCQCLKLIKIKIFHWLLQVHFSLILIKSALLRTIEEFEANSWITLLLAHPVALLLTIDNCK